MKEEDVWFLRGHGLLPVDGSFDENRRGGRLCRNGRLGTHVCLEHTSLLGIHGATFSRPGTPAYSVARDGNYRNIAFRNAMVKPTATRPRRRKRKGVFDSGPTYTADDVGHGGPPAVAID